MIKMYLSHRYIGNSPEFWEENWARDRFEQSVRFCAVDPLRPLFEKYSKEGHLLLEGGCGLGQYLAYYQWRGRRVIGVDFARKALSKLRLRQPNLPVSVGDVSALPFAGDTFDLYYSGGVVEHFEQGPRRALEEARRILKKDGILLISVPYCSPLRCLLLPFKRKQWRWMQHAETDPHGSLGDDVFFQYAYKPSEFEPLLRDAGLRVVEKQGYAVLWGMKEISFRGDVRQSVLAENSEEASLGRPAMLDIDALPTDPPRSILKRLLVSEDASLPLLGLGVRFMRWFAANMMMYVCIRDDSLRDA